MAAGSIDLAPLIWWGFAVFLVFVAGAAVVVRVVFYRRGRRGRGPTDPQLVTGLHR
jgi:hypothetical protein